MANQQLNGLKSINNIQRDGSLQNLLLSIKDAKVQVDAFSRSLQQKKSELQQKAKEEEKRKIEEAKKEEVKVVEKKVEADEPKVQTNTQTSFQQNKQIGNNYRKFDNQKTNNFAKKPPFNKQQQVGNKFQGNNKFQGSNKFGQNNQKSFVSTKANNFKSFAPTESSAVLATPERNFGNKNKRRNVEENKKPKQKQSFEKHGGNNNNIYVLGDEGFEETTMGSRKLIKKKKEVQTVIAPKITHAVLTSREITIKELSEKIGKPVAEIVKKCMLLGIMATINSTIDFDTCELICSDFGITLELKLDKSFEEKLMDSAQEDDEKDLVKKNWCLSNHF